MSDQFSKYLAAVKNMDPKGLTTWGDVARDMEAWLECPPDD